MRLCFYSLALWTALWATMPVRAEAPVLQLREALALVEGRLPVVESARARVREARAGVETRRAAWAPRVVVEASAALRHNRFRAASGGGRVPTGFRTTQSELGGEGLVEWTALDFGQRRGSVRAARAAHQQSRDDLGDTLRQARGFVLQVYLVALAAQQRLANERLTVERRTTLVSTIEALVKAGVRPRADAVRARVDLVAAERQVAVRESELAAAEGALAAAVGWDPTTRARPVALAEGLDALTPTPEEASEAAVTRRPDLAYQRHEVDRTRAESEAAVRALAPMGLFRGTTGLSRVQQRTELGGPGRVFEASGSFVMRWAGLDMTVWRQAKQARRSAESAQYELQAQALRVRTEAAQAAYEARRAQAALAQAQAVAEAAQVSRTTQTQRYEAGAASLIERLDAESVEQRSREQLVEATLDYELAHARLLTETDSLDRLLGGPTD